MTENELEELVSDCPQLFHMAESGSWPSIKSHGLLSTSALIDLYEIEGDERIAIERTHRPKPFPVSRKGLGGAVVRDQIPMSDAGLVRCLQDGLTPADWYAILNSKVFFWLTEERLLRLLRAKAYRDKAHDVLVLNTRSVIEEHREKIWLCPINSGATKPFPTPRGKSTFQRIPDYPYSNWSKKRKRGERVVELCVDQMVLDICKHTIEVRRMLGDNIEEIIA